MEPWNIRSVIDHDQEGFLRMANSQPIAPDRTVSPDQAASQDKAALEKTKQEIVEKGAKKAELAKAKEEIIEKVTEQIIEAESKNPESAVSEYKRAYHITIGVLIGVAVVGILLFIAISQR